MDNVLIDERRIHCDFSQSVAKLWNTHRRRTLKEAAQQIIQREQTDKEREIRVINPYNQGSRSDATKDQHDDTKERHHRHRSSSSSSRERRRYKKHKRSRSRSYDDKKRNKHHDDKYYYKRR